MKHALISAALYAAAALCLSSCNFVSVDGSKLKGATGMQEPSEHYTTKTYDGLEPFTRLDISMPAKVVYVQSQRNFIEVNAPDNIVDHMVVTVSDSLLSVGLDGTKFRTYNKDITVTLSSATLCGITANGAVDFRTEHGITAESFTAEFNGAADVNMDSLNAGKVSLCINGAADAKLHGLDCSALTVEVNGAGDCTIDGKVSGHADIAVHGAGDIDIRSLEVTDLDTSIKGAGRIRRK